MQINDSYPDIVIAGTGIEKLNQMTLETWDYLQNSEYVISNLNDSITREVLANELDAEIIDFSFRYDPVDDDKRYGTYYEIINTPLELAQESDGLITVLTVGHPGIWSFTTRATQWIGEEYWDLEVEMLPGISASAAIYETLNIDPAKNGVQEYSAPKAISENIELNSNFTFFGWLLSDLISNSQHPEEELTAAANYFSKQYSPETPAYFVRATKYSLTKDAIMEVPIDNIRDLEPNMVRGTTIVIPGENEDITPQIEFPTTQWSDDMISNLKSSERNETITYPDPVEPIPNTDHSDLLEVIINIYTDHDFYKNLRNNPEETLEPYDLADSEKAQLLNDNVIKQFSLPKMIRDLQEEQLDKNAS